MPEKLSAYAKVTAFIKQTESRQLAVHRESAQRLFEEAQTPVFEGGTMRVDTGFLRASFVTSLQEPALSVTFNPTPERPDSQRGNILFPYSGDPAALTIANATINDTIYGIWTANYAAAVDARFGIQRLPAQRWQSIVAQVCAEVKAKIQ